MSQTWRSHVTRMGWLRLVGSLKLYVSFAKEPCKRDDILQKRLVILRSILIVATPYEKVVSGIWMSHVTHMNESCHTYEWVMSYTWRNYIRDLKESCHTCEWVMSHIRRSHVTHVNESCHTYEGVMSHIRTSQMNNKSSLWVMSHKWMSLVAREWVMSHIWTSHVTQIKRSLE